MNFLEILEAIKEAHEKDVKVCKLKDWPLDGLCHLANILEECYRDEFLAYLREQKGDIAGYLWDRDKDNLERLEWLNKSIKTITKEEF